MRLSRTIFVCETSGRVHVCDAGCRRKVFDAKHGAFVCEVSGLVSTVSAWEDLGQARDAPLNDGEDVCKDGSGEAFGSGSRRWIAKAFEAGYAAANEEELRACW